MIVARAPERVFKPANRPPRLPPIRQPSVTGNARRHQASGQKDRGSAASLLTSASCRLPCLAHWRSV